MKHVSIDMINLEKHVDKFNIDVIRYFKVESLIINVIFSFIVMFAWFYTGLWDWSMQADLTSLIRLFVTGALLVLVTLTSITEIAINTSIEALRLASRRCLYSFVTMNLVIIFMLVVFGKLSWVGFFGDTIGLMLWGNIFCGTIAVSADLIIPAIRRIL